MRQPSTLSQILVIPCPTCHARFSKFTQVILVPGKDKFSLLGSQLQQQESQIFSRSLQQTNGLSRPTGPSKPSSSAPFPAPTSTTLKFDPGKFRRVNESSTVQIGGRNGSIKKTGLGSGPLDERDEELIASIEREFDFSYWSEISLSWHAVQGDVKTCNRPWSLDWWVVVVLVKCE